MKKSRKILAVILSIVFITGMFGSVYAEAASKVGKPAFEVKYINNKTGIRITIPKCKGADAYNIHIVSSGTIYDGYKNDENIIPIDLSPEGTTTFEIPGLVKGTYKITVYAVKLHWLTADEEYYREEVRVSKTKKVKIKAAKIKAAEKKYDFSDAKAGDTIIFGAYEQNGIMTDGKEDIEWIVLSKNGEDMLVMSKYAIESLPYNVDYTNTTWAECSLRQWLNKVFYKTAFTEAERSMIRKTVLENDDNPSFHTPGGKSTKDKVFILSVNDVLNPEYGFSTDMNFEDELRVPESTRYLWNQRSAFIDGNMMAIYTWLRNPGYGQNDAACVAAYGYVMDYGSGVTNSLPCVRPVITINSN